MFQEKKQIIVGLTGGIGAGKTFVGEIWSRLGFPVFNADIEAKQCMHEDILLQKRIQDVFGNMIYNNGSLDSKMLAEIVFKDDQKLNQLNKLVHPLVSKRFREWSKKQHSNIILKETAIIFESNSHIECDKVICVVADRDLRVSRVMKRDGLTAFEVNSRMKVQISQKEKAKRSDFVIVNEDGELLLPQIINISSLLA